MKKPFLVGIAGGSGSGKTTLAERLVQEIGKDKVLLISHDHYYHDQSTLSPKKRAVTNYDHPDAYETNLLISHLKLLLAGKAINQPIYDFVADTRSAIILKISPKLIIIVEGILIFENKELRDLFNYKIFVDTDTDIRLIRRISRDIKEAHRAYDYIIDKYLGQVRPMHLKFVEPTKKYANQIINEVEFSQTTLNSLIDRLKKHLLK